MALCGVDCTAWGRTARSVSQPLWAVKVTLERETAPPRALRLQQVGAFRRGGTPQLLAARDQRLVTRPYMSIPPGGMAGIASFCGMSEIRDSVVRIMPATLAAFSRADLVTLVGSTMPNSIMLPYWPLSAS